MVLVTLGTQQEPFERLLKYIEESDLEDEIIVQVGHTKFQSKKMKLFTFISYQEMDQLIDKADLIITHGGTGSIITPLKKGKKVIACSRLSRYKEHVDSHQEQLVKTFAQEGYILELNEACCLNDLLQQIEVFKPKKFISNSDIFIEKLITEIER